MRKLYVVFAVAVVLSVTTLPALARTTDCVDPAVLDDPQVLSHHWRSSLSAFADRHPDLPVDKLALLAEGYDLGVVEAFAVEDQGRRWYAEHGGPMQRWIGRMKDTFTIPELGEIFTGMGPVQLWMAQTEVEPVPLCNCFELGEPCSKPGSPEGVCQTGCFSWTGDDDRHRVGLCVLANSSEN